jgi:hypothetical protein
LLTSLKIRFVYLDIIIYIIEGINMRYAPWLVIRPRSIYTTAERILAPRVFGLKRKLPLSTGAREPAVRIVWRCCTMIVVAAAFVCVDIHCTTTQA